MGLWPDTPVFRGMRRGRGKLRSVAFNFGTMLGFSMIGSQFSFNFNSYENVFLLELDHGYELYRTCFALILGLLPSDLVNPNFRMGK